jgi:phenylpyruvate tautomerase PptA (4-oxalocrotonate tautomerase family)
VPVYQVATSGVELGREQRDTLAKRFDETHHEVTRPPEPPVRIVFQPMPLGLIYTAGEITPSFVLVASCRSRGEDERQELMGRLDTVIREVTGLPDDQITVIVAGTPPPYDREAARVSNREERT